MNNEQKMMLRRLSSTHFALVELNIFLDTHPNNKDALNMFNAYNKKYTRQLNEYQEKYGPITAKNNYDNTDWNWINGPWPWDNSKEMDK
mgnify:CR=1 FL=1